MRFKTVWLDRFWLGAIAVAFAIAVPIWLMLSIERLGWQFVLLCVAGALFMRYAPQLTEPS